MSDLSNSSLTWNGLTIDGREGRFTMSTLDGWEGWDGRQDLMNRPTGHGAFDARVWANPRVVRVTGLCASLTERDDLLVELGAAMTPVESGNTSELSVTHAGRTLAAEASLSRYAPTMSNWGAGSFGWAAEFVCPDPLRYGAFVTEQTTYPDLAGGLEYDLYTDGAGTDLGYLDYGAESSTGTVLLTNAGTAASWPTFDVAGPVDASGFEIIAAGSGARLRYEGQVPEGSALVLDGASGSVVMDGAADRGGLLTWRDWSSVPAGGSTEFVFVPLGASTGAVLTASLRPAYW